jgi:hypothetical protein
MPPAHVRGRLDPSSAPAALPLSGITVTPFRVTSNPHPRDLAATHLRFVRRKVATRQESEQAARDGHPAQLTPVAIRDRAPPRHRFGQRTRLAVPEKLACLSPREFQFQDLSPAAETRHLRLVGGHHELDSQAR